MAIRKLYFDETSECETEQELSIYFNNKDRLFVSIDVVGDSWRGGWVTLSVDDAKDIIADLSDYIKYLELKEKSETPAK
jgi:hypothetical protein